ncbi:MAG: hypothetical protein ACTSQE_16730 [Candidatus Heimdallarchaeaceae archaeon]
MQKIRFLMVVIVVLLITGCSTVNTNPFVGFESSKVGTDQIVGQLVEIHKQYIEAINKFELTSDDLVSIALFEVGFVRESMGLDLQNMKAEALAILDRYEEIARVAEGKELDNYEKGQIAGLRWRFLYLVGRKIVEKMGPEMLNVFKIVLAL